MKPAHKILVVDDDRDNRDSTQGILEQWGYAVFTAASGDEAIAQIRVNEDIALILMDYRMPGKDGAQTAQEIRVFNQSVVIAMYSCDDTQKAVIQSHRAGAIDFIEKDVDTDYLREAVKQGCQKYQEGLPVREAPLTEAPEKLIASVGMIGRSEKLARVATQIMMARSSRMPVLITGESGTGKELVAKALHVGQRGAFVAVNCASFSRDNQLLESELFGYEKGAFTGAVKAKAGVIEKAQGGTVMLDEIHQMDLKAQPRLLRAIQEKKIRRVGSTEEYSVDFRIVAATKSDIVDRVRDGAFLEDLYFRLRYLCIEVPSLRERPEDIEPLVTFFCKKYEEQTGHKRSFLVRAIRVLESHDWPGNIRELESYVFRILIECSSDVIDIKHLDLDSLHSAPKLAGMSIPDLEMRHERERRELLSSVIRRSTSMAQAAQRTRIPVTTLKSMAKRYGLQGARRAR